MKRLIVIGVLGISVLVYAAFQSTYYVVGEWQQGLVFQFGDPVRVVRDPGLYFKAPLIHDLVTLDKRVLGTEPQSAEYLTLDKKRLLVDHVSRWQITDPLLFYRTVRNEVARRPGWIRSSPVGCGRRSPSTTLLTSCVRSASKS